jgi:hypothetical protein
MNIIDTPAAAEKLHMSEQALRQFLYRNPDCRPALSVGPSFLWTEAEIETVRERRTRLRSRKGKPSGRQPKEA